MTKARAFFLCLVTLASLAVLVSNAEAACTDSWKLSVSGDWGTASNWSTGQVPVSTDDVCITIPGTYTVTLAPYVFVQSMISTPMAGDMVHSLTIGATEEPGVQTLVVSGQASVSGSNETVNSTELDLATGARVNQTGALVLDATGGGTPTPGGPVGGSATIANGTITNYGRFATQVEDPSWATYLRSNLAIQPRDAVNNLPSGSFEVASGTLNEDQGVTTTNNGSVRVDAGATLQLDPCQACANSTLLFTNSGPVANNGSIIMSNPTATWAQSAGAITGNPVVLENGPTLADAAGAAQFLLDHGSGVLTGTIPAGQTVTVRGAAYSSGGNSYNGTTVSLNGGQLVNNGSLVLDAPGSGTSSGGPATISNGSILNNAAIVAQVEDTAWADHLEAALINSHLGTLSVVGGALEQDQTTTTMNDGLVTVGPGATYSLIEAASFTNASDGTVSPVIASASSLGTFQVGNPCCQGPGTFAAGGTLAPVLAGGFLPTANQEFQIFTGGTMKGTFATIGSGFTADYSHPTYVGVVYGAITPGTRPGGPIVGAIVGGHGSITVALACPVGGAACSSLKLTATLFEHLRGSRIVAISTTRGATRAHQKSKQVIVASVSASLAAGTKKTVTLSLNATGRALVARFRKLTTVLTVSSGGMVARTTTVHVSKLARPKPKKK
jgi:hypothetical protein